LNKNNVFISQADEAEAILRDQKADLVGVGSEMAITDAAGKTDFQAQLK
jgi:2,4-dienoyl-CoA reductase-like NADH-dependent reductase (Old Yellow Enzyme family)